MFPISSAKDNGLRFACPNPPKLEVYWKDSQGKEHRRNYQLTWYNGNNISLGCFMTHIVNITLGPDYVNPGNAAKEMPKWGKHDVPKEILERLVQHFIKGISATFVLIGSNSNHGSKASPKNPVPPDGMVEVFDTTDFVEMLIKHKIGIVYASPIGRNAGHASQKDTSLCQIWIWIPPHKVDLILPGSAAVFNTGSEPSREAWAKGMMDKWSEYKGPKTWEEAVKLTFKPDSVFYDPLRGEPPCPVAGQAGNGLECTCPSNL